MHNEQASDPSAAISAIRRIAALVERSISDRFLRDADAFRKALAKGLPTPVLSIARANHLENAWTNYLAHMMDSGASGGLGAVIGPAVFEALTGKQVAPDQLHVLTEVNLGLACSECGHSCRIDLILVGPEDLVAIEQKVTSPTSDWKCRTAQNRVHGQLVEYDRLLRAKAPTIHRDYFPELTVKVEVHPTYLTISGNSEQGWQSISHAGLSAIVAGAVKSVRQPAERFSLLAMLVDWNSEPFGRWPMAIDQLDRLLRRTLTTSPTTAELIWYGRFLTENRTLCDLLLALGDDV